MCGTAWSRPSSRSSASAERVCSDGATGPPHPRGAAALRFRGAAAFAMLRVARPMDPGRLACTSIGQGKAMPVLTTRRAAAFPLDATFRALMERSEHGVLLIDPQHRVSSANPAALKLLGV